MVGTEVSTKIKKENMDMAAIVVVVQDWNKQSCMYIGTME